MARNKLAGQPRPQEVKDRISKTQRERYAKQRAQGFPGRKRCSKCKRIKDSPKDFGWMKRKLANGTEVWHPRSQCKKCSAERSAEYRKTHPYKKPVRSTKFSSSSRELVSVKPLADWLAKQAPLDREDDDLSRRIRSVREEEYSTVELATVDAILQAYGVPRLLTQLYPG